MVLCGHSLRSMACIFTSHWILWLEGVKEGVVTRIDRKGCGLPSSVHVDITHLNTVNQSKKRSKPIIYNILKI